MQLCIYSYIPVLRIGTICVRLSGVILVGSQRLEPFVAAKHATSTFKAIQLAFLSPFVLTDTGGISSLTARSKVVTATLCRINSAYGFASRSWHKIGVITSGTYIAHVNCMRAHTSTNYEIFERKRLTGWKTRGDRRRCSDGWADGRLGTHNI